MQSVLENVKIKDLDRLPHVVTIPIRAHINATKREITSGSINIQVTVAQVGKKLYPIDNIDVLTAYEESGSTSMPCNMEHLETLAEAQMRHVNLSTTMSINPFAASEAVEYVRARDENMVAGTEDKDFTKISSLPLAPEIGEMMSKYITALGERLDAIPSFFYVFRAVSKLDESVQVKAMDKVLEFCEKMATTNKQYSLPMPDQLSNILTRFDTKGKKIQKHPVEPETTKQPDGEEGGENDAKKDKSKNVMKVEEADDMPGYYHNADTNNVDFSCECGLKYVVNKKNLTVRKREEQEKMVLLKGDYGDPMYAIRNDAAEFLDLALQPSVYYYMMSKDPHGSTVIMSKYKITDGTLKKIMADLKG